MSQVAELLRFQLKIWVLNLVWEVEVDVGIDGNYSLPIGVKRSTGAVYHKNPGAYAPRAFHLVAGTSSVEEYQICDCVL